MGCPVWDRAIAFSLCCPSPPPVPTPHEKNRNIFTFTARVYYNPTMLIKTNPPVIQENPTE